MNKQKFWANSGMNFIQEELGLLGVRGQITDASTNIDELQKHWVKQKIPDTKLHIVKFHLT